MKTTKDRSTSDPVAFHWTIRGMFYKLFWMFTVQLLVLLLIALAIAMQMDFGYLIEVSGNRWFLVGLLLPWAFRLLEWYFGNSKTIAFRHDQLIYFSKRKGIIHQIQRKDIKAIGIQRIGRNNYGLFIRTTLETIRIKLTWAWVWNVWKLERNINKLRAFYQISAF